MPALDDEVAVKQAEDVHADAVCAGDVRVHREQQLLDFVLDARISVETETSGS